MAKLEVSEKIELLKLAEVTATRLHIQPDCLDTIHIFNLFCEAIANPQQSPSASEQSIKNEPLTEPHMDIVKEVILEALRDDDVFRSSITALLGR